MDASRARLSGQFADDPQTRQQLLEVLSRTYMALNRFDEALPLGEQWLALARSQHGPTDAPVLLAQLSLGQINQIMGNHDAAIGLLEPLAVPLAQRFGPDSEEVRQQQFILAADYMHSRRLADAEAALARVRVLTDRLHPGDDYERADYLLNLGVLRRLQGRSAESLAVVRETRPLWASPDPRLTLPVLVLRRHELFMMSQNAEFDGMDARVAPLVADVRRAMGPGNDFALMTLSSWATAKQLQGLHMQEATVRQQLLDSARADGLAPESLLVFRAELLLAQARLGRPDVAALQGLVAEAAAQRGGSRRSRSLLLLADAALAADAPSLAADAVARLRELPLPAALAAPGSKLDRTEGRLARANGQFARSLALLSGVQDIGLIETWAGRLDVALSAVLQGAPEADALLAAARRARPPALPAGHPLDRVSQWLTARQSAGRDDTPNVRQAWTALAEARGPGAPAPTLGNLGGLLP
ncbi:hypothetical protein DBR42_24345 [Pelomonas sp. HMWF004]|nr:hypothetical protein DBR42_24345 [Pelomonas sp. HMWF004]